VLISTAYIRDCIEQKEKTKLIRDAIAAGTSQYGMQTFDQSLYMLYKQGLITLEEALRRATNPDELRLRIQGIQSTADISREEMEGALDGQSEASMFAPGTRSSSVAEKEARPRFAGFEGGARGSDESDAPQKPGRWRPSSGAPGAASRRTTFTLLRSTCWRGGTL